jgi:threonine/homoserine/homoserine lactone efflux protein
VNACPRAPRAARSGLCADRFVVYDEGGVTLLIKAIGELLPSAVGVALSPVPIIAVILMLGTARARSNGVSFAIGWVAGLIIVSAIVLVLASGADDADSASATGVNWGQVAIGVLFLIMAVAQWRKRPRAGDEPAMPKWMTTIDSFTPAKSLGLGALLSGVNPKNLALTASAAASIAQAGLSGGESTAAVAVFVSIGSLTVAGPVAFYLAAPPKAGVTLGDIKQFLSEHNAVIMMVVLLILGVKLIGQGIGLLAS